MNAKLDLCAVELNGFAGSQWFDCETLARRHRINSQPAYFQQLSHINETIVWRWARPVAHKIQTNVAVAAFRIVNYTDVVRLCIAYISNSVIIDYSIQRFIVIAITIVIIVV